MSRIPSFPFRTVVTNKPVGDRPPQIEQHNYTSLAGAIVYRDIALRRQKTKKVEVVMVIDESTPGHRE